MMKYIAIHQPLKNYFEGRVWDCGVTAWPNHPVTATDGPFELLWNTITGILKTVFLSCIPAVTFECYNATYRKATSPLCLSYTIYSSVQYIYFSETITYNIRISQAIITQGPYTIYIIHPAVYHTRRCPTYSVWVNLSNIPLGQFFSFLNHLHDTDKIVNAFLWSSMDWC